jgi:uncharacterized phage protein gp47/JayE
MTMKRLAATVAILVSATPAFVLADETIKAKNDCFEELSAQANGKAQSTSLGRRRTVEAPVVEEVEVMRLEPLSSNDVQKVVREHLAEIQYCYDRVASRGKAPTGEVNLAMSIEPSGRVTSVTARAIGISGRNLEKCIRSAAKRWRFPSANTETLVDYPLVFDLAGPAQ